MNPYKYILQILFLSFLFVKGAIACYVPYPGHGLDGDELIKNANTIVLVVAEATKAPPKSSAVQLQHTTLRTLEVLKGELKSAYSFSAYYELVPSDNDFNGHTAKEFWEKNEGRSQTLSNDCLPDHSFRTGATYLYFPDKLGAMKSAELIRKPDDQWLSYVRSKLKPESR